jgi:predicted  nucleic acid-binding Zn-ribbon protein
MTEQLDIKLRELKQLEDGIKALTTDKDKLREEVLNILQEEKLSQYKNDVATVSTMERKVVKYLIKPEELIKTLPEQYIEVIPEHKEIKSDFEAFIKNGNKFEGVELETKESIVIRLK